MKKFVYLIVSAKCLLDEADVKLRDVRSKSQMINNGWSFDITIHKPVQHNATCGMHNTWYGFKYPGDGTVNATFTGSGIAILDYGNCVATGSVNVHLNSQLKDVAQNNTPSTQITFEFSPSDVLRLSESGESVIKINSLNLTCKGNTFFYA